MWGRSRNQWVAPVRPALLIGGAALTGDLVRRLVSPPLHTLAGLLGTDQPLTSLSLAVVVAAGCAAALAACWLWLVVCAVLVAADLRFRGCPRLVRTLVVAALGLAVGAAPSYADPGSTTGSTGRSRDTPGPGVLGLSLPDRVATGSTPTLPRVHRVRPGDTLWDIAAGHLPATAPDAAVSRGCRRLAAANVDRIGSDPDLIFPGTVLLVPSPGGPLGSTRKEAS